MAELCVKIKRDGDGSKFEDGDIIHAMNDRRIFDVHAQHICHVKDAPRNGKYVAGNTLFEDYLKNVMQYKFERISDDTVKRTDLWTGEVEHFNATPNANKEHMDVPLFIARRLQSDKNQIFGSKGNERWYGGHTKASLTALGKVWTEIEAKSAYRKVDFTEFPFTDNEKIKYRILKVNDFTDEQRGEYESSLLGEANVEGNQEVLKQRRYKVNYNELDNSRHNLSIVKVKN